VLNALYEHLLTQDVLVQVSSLLVRVHQAQLVGTSTSRLVLLTLQKHLRPRLQELKDTIGTNMAALKTLQRAAEDRSRF
jgi:hypothetical protein